MMLLGEFSRRLHALQDPVALGAVKDWPKVVVPYLVLADCIEAIKFSLSYGHSLVALACKRYSKQYLNLGDYANLRHTTHLFAGCGHK